MALASFWRVEDQPLSPNTDICPVSRGRKFLSTPSEAEFSGDMMSDQFAGGRWQVGIRGFQLAGPVPCLSLFLRTQPERGDRGCQDHCWAQLPGRLGVIASLTQFSARILRLSGHSCKPKQPLPLTCF